MFGRKRKLLESVAGVVAPGIAVEYEKPVKEAAKASKSIALPPNVDADTEKHRLTALRREMFAMEQSAMNILDKRLAELNYAELDSQFQRVDLSILRWRRKDGWPVFAPFMHNKAECFYGVSYVDYRSTVDPWDRVELEWVTKCFLRSFYSDVFEKMDGMIRGRKRLFNWLNSQSITAKFSGIVPKETRQTIKRHLEKKSFDAILIVAEAQWIELAAHKEPDPDPLVIGIKDQMGWLVDQFDITPAERIVASEFAYGQPKEKDWEK